MSGKDGHVAALRLNCPVREFLPSVPGLPKLPEDWQHPIAVDILRFVLNSPFLIVRQRQDERTFNPIDLSLVLAFPTL